MTRTIDPAALMVNPDGSIYHLALLPEDVADTVICVGSPERVATISQYFDEIEIKKQHREFITHTGVLNKKRLTVVSSGIGTDNIDIVMNELDAVVNVSLTERQLNTTRRVLNIIRLGTCGGVAKALPVDSIVISHSAIGLDSLLNFYKFQPNDYEIAGLNTFLEILPEVKQITQPYFVQGCDYLFHRLKKGCEAGITITSPGFFAPQGRWLRAEPHFPNLLNHLHDFSFQGEQILNLEMETSALFGLGKILGHHCATLAVTLNNRDSGAVSANPMRSVLKLIESSLEAIVNLPDNLPPHQDICQRTPANQPEEGAA